MSLLVKLPFHSSQNSTLGCTSIIVACAVKPTTLRDFNVAAVAVVAHPVNPRTKVASAGESFASEQGSTACYVIISNQEKQQACSCDQSVFAQFAKKKPEG